jgi:hypothetical protein
MKRSKDWLFMLSFAGGVLAASWWGAFDAPFDPRQASNQEIGDFIRGDVNASGRGIWQPGDFVTICQAGTNSCVLAYYAPGTAVWAKARNVDNRSRPAES